MKRSPEERAQTERFDELYLRAQAPVMRLIERSVCGCEYGGNSWTTRAEADRIAKALNLQHGRQLLDLGAGSGWPGLYLCATSGCKVFLVDLPLSGLRIAAARADDERISKDIAAAVADAASLPFANGSFDAINHSDLLCCLKNKRPALTACRQMIRPVGRMAFTVISVAPGLSQERYRRALANGPEFIDTDTDYRTLLAETNWVITDHEDVTAAYAASCGRQLAADVANIEELTALIGAEEYAERLDGWHAKLAALDEGLLQRELFVTAPSTAAA